MYIYIYIYIYIYLHIYISYAYSTSHLVNFSDVLRRDLVTTKNPFDSCSALPVGDDLTCFFLLGSLHLLGDYCRTSFAKQSSLCFG